MSHFKTKEEAENYISTWIDKVAGELGCAVERWSYDARDWGTHETYWISGANLKYLNYDLGKVCIDYFHKWDEKTRRYVDTEPTVRFGLSTKVTFTMKSTFTKSNMRHEVNIKLNVHRSMGENEYKKFIDWAKKIMMQLKTAEAKKKKFEADTDFE
jgi:hypothetical protein